MIDFSQGRAAVPIPPSVTTRPLLRSSSSSVGVSAAVVGRRVSVDSVTISRKWYRKPHSEHHAVRQGEHSILQCVQLARRRHRARREGTPVETLSNPARAAPCSTRQPRLPSPQSSLIARASTLDTHLGRYYLPGTYRSARRQGAHQLPRPRCSTQSRWVLRGRRSASCSHGVRRVCTCHWRHCHCRSTLV